MPTVLIVEDNELNMKLFSDLLTMQGFDVLRGTDGMEGVRIARETRPDLVLMDMQLPLMSGPEALVEIRADPALSQVPILAVTAYAMKGDAERIMRAGFDGYIAKPINVGQFITEVRKYLSATSCAA